MTDLTAIITSGSILKVDVGANPIVKILNFLIDSVKTLDSRVLELENISKTHVTREEHENLENEMKTQNSAINGSINYLNNRIIGIKTDMETLESKINLTINDKHSEVLVSTNMKVQNAISTIDAEVQNSNRFVKDFKADVDEFMNKMNKINFDQLSRTVAENAKDISTIRKEMVSQKSNEFDISKLNINIDDDGKLIEQVNQHSKFLVEMINELKTLKEQMSEMDNKKYDKESSLEFEENITKLRSDFDNNQNDLISAMKAIQDELQTIRDNGNGLENLPQMDLQSVVESYFNPPYSNRIEKLKEPIGADHRIVINMNNIPCVPVVKHVEHTENTPSANNKNIMLSSSASTKSSELFELERQSSVQSLQQAPPVVITEKVDIDDIIQKIKQEIDLSTIQDTFNRYQKQHNELMNAIDRKVDREYVERLFDKFRIIVHNLNDRFKELASLNEDYATKEEISLIVQVLKALPKESRPGTAVKKGPTCLFCGRPKTSIAGEITPRTAAMAGTPPVQNITMEGNSTCEFIYGDGQAYRRDENFQSFPHFDVLPPLPQTDKEEGTGINTNNSAARPAGRVSFVQPTESPKASGMVSTSSSSPTSRLQKIRK